MTNSSGPKGKEAMLKELREMNAKISFLNEKSNLTTKGAEPILTLLENGSEMYDEFLKQHNITAEEHFYKLKEKREAAEAKDTTEQGSPTPPTP
jgi:tellurite resistance protein